MTRDYEAVVTQAKKPLDAVACVVTQVMGAGTKARPGFELVTQVSGVNSNRCQLNWFSTWGI